MLDVGEVTLEGRWVRLEPLTVERAEELASVAAPEAIWRYLPVAFTDVSVMRTWAETALGNREAGSELPFVIIERDSGKAIGSTRFMDIRPAHRGLEIGYTWLGQEWWRTKINSEAKFLLLRHCFQTLGCIRVALKTDLLNTRSQHAIERLGAVREGVLRQHMVAQHGRLRDSVYYSILDHEWPAIRVRMEKSLYEVAQE